MSRGGPSGESRLGLTTGAPSAVPSLRRHRHVLDSACSRNTLCAYLHTYNHCAWTAKHLTYGNFDVPCHRTPATTAVAAAVVIGDPDRCRSSFRVGATGEIGGRPPTSSARSDHLAAVGSLHAPGFVDKTLIPISACC